jgi:cytoplasmic iron level regulating protein YaaA (DUF328/UPF0246 family)
MIVLLSPSKTLDFESKPLTKSFTQPVMLKDSELLINELRKYSPEKLAKLMDLSDKLAHLNYDRYQVFNTPFSLDNARQALLAFKGDVYDPLALESYSKADFDFAQHHIRILSGLYGLLRPLDLMQPYRLEMGTTLNNKRGKNLYKFWGKTITDEINKSLKADKNKMVINLASVEYFHSVQPESLEAPLLNIVFKEKQKGGLKIIGLFAKKARGMMTNFIIKNHIDKPESLKDFDEEGYVFQPSLSNSSQWLFTR